MAESATVTAPSPGVLHGLRRAVVDERDGPLPAMLVALTALAGVVDAASVLGLGGVFVATVTGNIVFVALGLAGADGFPVVRCLLSIGGFVLGALVGGWACRSGRGHRGRALRDVLHVKVVLATTVTAVVVLAGDDVDGLLRDLVIVLLAMSMGVQLAAIRYLRVPDLLTAMITLTITGALIERGLGWAHPAVLRRIVAVSAFAVGALAGGLLVVHVGLGAALGLGLAIIVVVAIVAQRAARSSASWTAPR